MIAVLVNAITVVLGSLLGLSIKNSVDKRITDAIMAGIGLFTVYIGITGLSADASPIVYLLAIITGGTVGTLINIEEKIDVLAGKVQKKLAGDGSENSFAAGLTGFFIMSCVGAFTVVASFKAGLGDNTMLYTKAVMDFIVSFAMASALGSGVLFAVVPIVLFETVLVCFSRFLSTFLSEEVIESFSCMGSVLTLAIGTNIMGITDFKVVNYVPCLLFAPLFAFISGAV